MGNDASRADADKKAALSKFSSVEKEAVQELFLKLSSKDNRLVTENALQNHIGELFSAEFKALLFRGMAHAVMPVPIQKINACISEQNFYTALAYLLNGDADQQVHMLRLMASSEVQLSATKLFQLVLLLMRTYHSVLTLTRQSDISKVWGATTPPNISDFEEITFLTLADLFYPDKKAKEEASGVDKIPDVSYSTDDLVRWIGYASLFSSALSCVVNHAFPVCEMPHRSLLPIFAGKSASREHTDLLSPFGILAINQAIPYKHREKWTLLFDSRTHGESFTTLLRNVKNHRNTVLVVRDTDGHMYGGFSTAVWSNNAAFQGSIDNFLFSLKPSVRIYRPTGLNTNYFYLNTGQETFPNGMGMGGQLNYFAFWLDCEYGLGHSMAKPLSTTYHSPTLSKQPEFHYTDVEVWKVSNIQEDLEEAEAKAEQRGATSILDSDPGAKAILDMIGKGGLSDGLRESDPTASNPEETHPPVL